MKTKTIQEYLDDQVIRCADLVGHSSESIKIEHSIALAQKAIANHDVYAMLVAHEQLKRYV